ncbi:hypothetical protein SDC9_149580 [bioreactor metagenome]|uniref:Uncharacterized protein n=1 Tax=bioreactor metagenome TaxID=1076179 RepID=A0A645ENZ2_9ZZZZ
MINHVGGINCIDGYFVADNFKKHQIISSSPGNLYLNFRPFWPPEFFHNIRILNLFSGHQFFVDVDDAVAGHYSDFFGRTASDGLHNQYGVFENLKLNTYSFETTF